MSDAEELARLRAENARLKELLDKSGNVVYIAIQDGEGNLSKRIKTCVKLSYAEQTYFTKGWTVYRANLDNLTIDRVHPAKD